MKLCHSVTSPGFLSAFVALDNPASSALAEKLLGLRPDGPVLITDIEQGHCFSD
jgi:hypothetical protein